MFTAAEDFTTTTVTVTPYLGVTAVGESFGSPVTVACFVSERRKLVRDPQGQQVISETTLFTELANISDPTTGAPFTPDSNVTVNGRTSTVILAKRNEIGDPDVDHYEIAIA